MWFSLKKIQAKSSGWMWVKLAFSVLLSLALPITLYYLIIKLVPVEPTSIGNMILDSIMTFIYFIHRFLYYSTITMFGVPQNIASLTMQITIVSLIVYSFLRQYFKGLIMSMIDIALLIIIYFMFSPGMTIHFSFDIPSIDAVFELSLLPLYQLIMIGVICMNILDINIILYEYQHKDCYHIGFFNENNFTTEGDVNKSRKINEELRTIEYMRENEEYCKKDENKSSKVCTTYDVVKRQYDLPNIE